MADLQAEFDQAQADVKALTTRPGNDDLRQLYGFYKQATVGDASTSGIKRPGRFDVIGRAKYDAWDGMKSTSAEDAMRAYVQVVNRLLGR